MFKAVIVADLHLKTTDKYGKILPSGMNSRLQDKLDALAKSVKYAIEHGVDYWIFLGDIFDKINPAELLRQKFIEAITPLIKENIKIIILVGNHDTDFKIYSLMSETALLGSFNQSAIRIVSEPSMVQLKGVNCLMLPWSDDRADNQIAVRKLTDKTDLVIFGHIGVAGALVTGSEIVLNEGISPKLFQNHRFAFLGHYHKPQSTKTWMYVGSIAKEDFGERNDKKGFIYAEIGEDTLKHKFIDVKDRVFFQHTINQEDDPDFKTLQKWHNLEGRIVKLIFVGDEDWYLGFNLGEIRSKVLKEGQAHKIFIDYQTTYQYKTRVPEVDASSSWDEGIEAYCKRQKKSDLVELGKSILQEVT